MWQNMLSISSSVSEPAAPTGGETELVRKSMSLSEGNTVCC